MRTPSIHIKEDDFYELLRSIDITIDGTGHHTLTIPDHAIHRVILKAKQKACYNRNYVATNNKSRKRVDKALSATKQDADMLANVIYAYRIKLKHQGVSKIKEDSREWLQVKELTSICNLFCSIFNLEKRAGYIQYITFAFPHIKSMRNFLGKFIALKDTIIEDMQAELKLSDISKDQVRVVHDYYVDYVVGMSGMSLDYTSDKKSMNIFAEVIKIANELEIDPCIYIDAQFDALEWCNGIPDLPSLISIKGKERWAKYLAQYEQEDTEDKETTDWNQILKAK